MAHDQSVTLFSTHLSRPNYSFYRHRAIWRYWHFLRSHGSQSDIAKAVSRQQGQVTLLSRLAAVAQQITVAEADMPWKAKANMFALLKLTAALQTQNLSRNLDIAEVVSAVLLNSAYEHEMRAIVLPIGDKTMNFEGMPYLLYFILPNVYFHVTTSYDILRHCGVELGKIDFLGKPS